MSAEDSRATDLHERHPRSSASFEAIYASFKRFSFSAVLVSPRLTRNVGKMKHVESAMLRAEMHDFLVQDFRWRIALWKRFTLKKSRLSGISIE